MPKQYARINILKYSGLPSIKVESHLKNPASAQRQLISCAVFARYQVGKVSSLPAAGLVGKLMKPKWSNPRDKRHIVSLVRCLKQEHPIAFKNARDFPKYKFRLFQVLQNVISNGDIERPIVIGDPARVGDLGFMQERVARTRASTSIPHTLRAAVRKFIDLARPAPAPISRALSRGVQFEGFAFEIVRHPSCQLRQDKTPDPPWQ